MDRLLWGVTYGGVRRSAGPDCPRGEPDPSVRTRAKQKQKPARSVTNSGLGPVLGSGGLGHAPRRPGPIGWGIPGGRLPLSGGGRSRLRSAAGLRGRAQLVSPGKARSRATERPGAGLAPAERANPGKKSPVAGQRRGDPRESLRQRPFRPSARSVCPLLSISASASGSRWC